MKKSKFLISVLILALMLMGAGYAYWSEEIELHNDIYTGEFDVDLVCVDGLVEDIWVPCLDAWADNIYMEIVPNDAGTKFIIDDIYPGASAVARLGFQNEGTVPAVCDGFEAYISADAPFIVEYSLDGIYWYSLDQFNPGCHILYPETTNLDNDDYNQFYGCTCDDDPCTCGFQYTEKYSYKNCCYLFIKITMDPAVEYNQYENQYFAFDLLFNFTQWNE